MKVTTPQFRRCMPVWPRFPFHSIVSSYQLTPTNNTSCFLPYQAIFTKTHLVLQTGPKTYKHGNEIMCFLDVTFLFTNVPLDETIHICLDKSCFLFLTFRNYLVLFYRIYWNLPRRKSSNMFDGPYFDQRDSLAMDSILGPILPNSWRKMSNKLRILSVAFV